MTNILDMTKEQLMAVPETECYTGMEFDNIIVIPGEILDSGYRRIWLVGCNDKQPIVRFGDFTETLVFGCFSHNLIGLRVDCLPGSGLFHYFMPGFRFVIEYSLSECGINFVKK